MEIFIDRYDEISGKIGLCLMILNAMVAY